MEIQNNNIATYLLFALAPITTALTFLYTIGRGIFQKGTDHADVINRITNLEKWKLDHTSDYNKLLLEIEARRNEVEDLRNDYAKILARISYIDGRLDEALGNGGHKKDH